MSPRRTGIGETFSLNLLAEQIYRRGAYITLPQTSRDVTRVHVKVKFHPSLTFPAFPPYASVMSQEVPSILTVEEVAEELRCSRAHVHNLIGGKVPAVSPLPSIALGRRRLVRRESLDAWIAKNEHGKNLYLSAHAIRLAALPPNRETTLGDDAI